MWAERWDAVTRHYSERMPGARVDAERLLRLASALTPVREHSRDGAEELLSHFVVTGDRDTQQAVDLLLEQAADALGGIDEEATEQALRLREVARGATGSGTRTPSAGAADRADDQAHRRAERAERAEDQADDQAHRRANRADDRADDRAHRRADARADARPADGSTAGRGVFR